MNKLYNISIHLGSDGQIPEDILKQDPKIIEQVRIV